jgi:MSHA pilin protein MshA
MVYTKGLKMSASIRNTRQAGFTLVELVVVILILGILAAVALPKFMNLGQDARLAKAQGLYGSVRSAMQIGRAGALVRNLSTSVSGTLSMDNTNVNLAYGYPDATANGIITAANIDPVNDNVTITYAAGSVTIDMTGAAVLASCRITYTAATNATTPATAALTASLANC